MLAALVALPLLGAAGFVAHYESLYRERAHGLDENLATLRRLHWERPALRGSPGSGNAAAEAYAALSGFTPLPPALRTSLADKVYYGQTTSQAESAAIAEREPALKALRVATQQSWAFTELAPELANSMRVPDYPRVVDAAVCLLAQARSLPPAECLRTAADVVRLGQDLVPGAPLEAASTSTRLSSLASRVVPRCAMDADLATLRRAVHEFNVLATHPPPTGAGIELQDLVTAVKLRERAALTNKASAGEVMRTLMARPRLLSAWTTYDNPARFRRFTPAQYPDATEDWKRERDYRERSGPDFLAGDSAGVLGRLHDDMRGQAILRMLTVGLATLADRAYRGKLPSRPSTLDELSLADPFRGTPFSFRIATNGAELTLWSFGENERDDGGSSEWGDSAPEDVVVYFPLNKTSVVRL